MSDPLTVSILIGIKAFALTIGKADKALTRPFFADKTRGQCQQVIDLHRQHRAPAGMAADFLTNKTTGLPMFRDAGARQHGHPGK